MQVQVDEIVIKKRLRKDLGNLAPLKKSMQQFGLMNPILITQRKELIAGHRRLESARQLGWETIKAEIIQDPSTLQRLEMEIEENVQRRNLTTDELAEGYSKIDKLQHPGLFKRIWEAIKRFFRRLFGRGKGKKTKRTF